MANKGNSAPTLTVTDTILVKGEVKSVGETALTLYFTNKKRFGGGEIASILLNDDQATVTFCDPSVAVKIAETKMHTIMGKDLTVELKKPTAIQKTSIATEHEQAAILVSNVTDSISDDLLYLYFDNITELDRESGDYIIRRCDDSLQVIISFTALATLPTGGIDAVIASINCTPLEGVVLTATRSPVVIKPKPIIFTNDVTISNLSADKCSTKALHKYFANKKKSGINTYKAIKIINKTTAVLQLKDESAVQTVLNRKHNTLGKHVVLTRCTLGSEPSTDYGLDISTGSVVTEKNLPHNVTFSIEVPKHYMVCIDSQQQQLEAQLKVYCAVMHIDTMKSEIIIVPCKGNEMIKDWQKHCKDVIEIYLKRLKTETFGIPLDKKDFMHPLIRATIQIEKSLNIDYVEDRSLVIIAGELNEVNRVKRKLENAYKSIISETVLIDDKKHFLLLNVKIDELLSNHPEVKATIESDNPHVTLLGFKDKVDNFIDDLTKLKSKMMTVQVLVTSMFSQFLSQQVGMDLLQYYLQEFRSEVATYFDTEGNLFIIGTGDSNAANALAAKIQSSLSFTYVSYPVIFQKSIESATWATLSASLERKHFIKISVLKNEIKIIGDSQMSKLAKKEIEHFVDTECFSERSFQLCDAQWRCIKTQLGKKWKRLEQKLRKESKIQLMVPSTNEKDPCIVIKGERSSVALLEKEVMAFLALVVSSPNPINEKRLGIIKYFCSENGRVQIRLIESQQQSCVQINLKEIFPQQLNVASSTKMCTGTMSQDKQSTDTIESHPRHKSVASITSQYRMVCSGTTVEGKTVTVYHGDITALSVDVMVSVTNRNLQHTEGVALAIATKGGSCIQNDSDAYLQTVTGINEGDVIFAQNVGNLPCKSLIHVVSPKWSGGTANERQVLSKACFNALEVAATNNFQTVSVPIIGSGSYGFPIGICAKIMIEAVLKYSQTCPSSSVTECSFVMFHQHEVDEFFEEMKQMFQTTFIAKAADTALVEDSYVIIDKEEVTSNHYVKNIDKPQAFNASVNQSVDNQNTNVFQNIELHKGNLLNYSADLYVNTVGSNLVLKNGTVAYSFLKAGGQALQDECDAYIRQHGQVPVAGTVITKPGVIPCLGIIHTVGTEYTGKQSEDVLKNIVIKCLIHCENRKASCIAFPALGAGNLKFPIAVVSKVMITTIADYLKSNHGTTQIKTVKLVIYMESDFQEFQRVLKSLQSHSGNQKMLGTSNASALPYPVKPSTGNNAANTVHQPNIVGTFVEVDIRIEIITGDITDDDSDAIVLTVDDHLQQGEFYVTTAPVSLLCKNIFHVVLNGKNLADAISMCLCRAEANQLASIAFPALGISTPWYSVQEAADIMYIAISIFALLDPIHLRTVRIILYQQSVVNCYTDVFARLTKAVAPQLNIQTVQNTSELKPRPSLIARTHNVVTSHLYGTKTIKNSHSGQSDMSLPSVTKYSELTMEVFSDDIKKVKKTEACLQQLIENLLKTDVINDRFVSKLTSNQQDDIKQKAKASNVEITMELGRLQHSIQLKGDPDDILEVKTEIHATLIKLSAEESKQKDILLIQTKVKWQWENPTGGIEDYDPAAVYAIEQAYQSDKTKLYVYQDAQGLREEFDFLQMKAKDLKDQSIYKIKRLSVDHTCDLPSEWCPMPEGKVCHFEPLDVKGKEYNDVKTLFESSMPLPSPTLTKYDLNKWHHIVKIERIQNPLLYSQYMTRKKAMDLCNPKDHQNERRLFHGCPKVVTEQISHLGFNRSFAGKHATRYGRGVYFAQDASYSANNTYSPRDNNYNKYILLARVLTGEYTLGCSTDIQPPQRSSDKDLYDSSVDDMQDPQIFVIFNDTQAYPEYRITFQ